MVFEDEEPSIQRMKCSFVFALWFWAKMYPDFESCNFTDFLFLLGPVWTVWRDWYCIGSSLVLVFCFSGFSEPFYTSCILWVCPVS